MEGTNSTTSEIDYGALFGVDLEGEREQEPAEPAADTDAQGEKEQEPAEPAEQEEESGNQDPDGEAEAGEGESGAQSADENAKYAAARRKAEAERDAAIEKARQDAKAEAARAIDEFYARSGLMNPYTQKPITTKAEYDAYRQHFYEERKKAFQAKSGMSDAEYQEFVGNLPEVQEAREAKARLERAEAETREAEAKVKVSEQLKEIGKLDPSIRELGDLAKMPTYPRLYELVKNSSLTLVEAFKLANYDALAQGAAAGARQAALNAIQGKQHLSSTRQRGAGQEPVPAEVMEQYRAFNPDATEAEIRAHYARSHKNK